MDDSRRIYISQLAETIRESMKLNSPVNLEVLVSNLGGKLLFENEVKDNMEALIQKKNGSFEIIIDRDKPFARQRFSIAHEIGHLFLHMGYLINPDKWNQTNDYVDSVYYRFGYSAEENEANEFAAALLMPSEEFKRVANQSLSDGIFFIEPIAKHFDVSREAIINRGKWLGLFQW